jgi:hypothetical protein
MMDVRDATTLVYFSMLIFFIVSGVGILINPDFNLGIFVLGGVIFFGMMFFLGLWTGRDG